MELRDVYQSYLHRITELMECLVQIAKQQGWRCKGRCAARMEPRFSVILTRDKEETDVSILLEERGDSFRFALYTSYVSGYHTRPQRSPWVMLMDVHGIEKVFRKWAEHVGPFEVDNR